MAGGDRAGITKKSRDFRKSGSSTAAVDGQREGQLARDLAHLRRLLEDDAVEEARAFVRELECKWPDSDRVHHWARVLAPPRSMVGPAKRVRPLHREQAWLREHAEEYPGCWMAVFEDRLIAADPSLKKVLAATRQSIGTDTALLHFQPTGAYAVRLRSE